MAELTETVKEMYAAFANNDRQAILAKLDEKVMWEFEAPKEISFSGKRNGISETSRFFEAISSDYKDPKLQITDFVASGNEVAAFGRYSATVKETGRQINSPVAHFFKFKDGKVVRFVNFLNTADFVEPKAATTVAATAPEVTRNAAADFYSHWIPIALAYGVTFILMLFGPLLHNLWPLWTGIMLFTVWDLGWIACKPVDRTAQEIMESSARARTYMSYFVAVYGAGLAYFLLRMGSQEQAQVFTIVRGAGVPVLLLVSPFALPTVAMLFFLIQLGVGNGTNLGQKAPTKANLVVLMVAAWIEKVATFSFVYVVTRISVYLTETQHSVPLELHRLWHF
jgi:ketosteroid isomerase-like protein